jgi:galactokinase
MVQMVSSDWLSVIFEQEFNERPHCFRSPGRINLIGEHTDYNQGFVLPSGIDLFCHVAIKESSSKRFTFHSIDLREHVVYEEGQVFEPKTSWANYILGVKYAFNKRGFTIPPFNLVIKSDVPIGAGLSSSAALESVIAFGLNEVFSLGLNKMDLTWIAKEAENDFIGLQCGIMDMFASIHAKKNNAMLLDCKSLAFEYVPLELGNNKLLLFDTQVKHHLASSEYNTRRLECMQAVDFIKLKHVDIESLRDVNMPMLMDIENKVPENIFNRAKHVVTENNRLHEFSKAIASKNWALAGALLYDSHDSLKKLYEVSCPELDLLVDVVKGIEGVWGARMMGGGFGGCTLNLVSEISVDEIIKEVNHSYFTAFGIVPKHYIASTSDGASSF